MTARDTGLLFVRQCELPSSKYTTEDAISEQRRGSPAQLADNFLIARTQSQSELLEENEPRSLEIFMQRPDASLRAQKLNEKTPSF